MLKELFLEILPRAEYHTINVVDSDLMRFIAMSENSDFSGPSYVSGFFVQ